MELDIGYYISKTSQTLSLVFTRYPLRLHLCLSSRPRVIVHGSTNNITVTKSAMLANAQPEN